ncbi:PREDICTED: uncharacterized protein LOC104806634 [Tarenaya hassleriana]|uniref:uncharacterized protein LOC104806634 n=1 Tax=Tarenaya hassleriana TaxID=28532 RepID=UPI00053C9E4A|nr:PREDICTED: uncharacterized protein LOC104806634 [Tarenaya hassleriana]
MGKSIPTKTGLRAAADASLKLVKSLKSTRPVSANLRSVSETKLGSEKVMESASGEAAAAGSIRRVPLSAGGAGCAKRWFKETLQEAKAGDTGMQVLVGQMYYSGYGWFKETLQEAKAGDTGMQVLVGQMYYSGYGVPRDDRKGRLWISKASKIRSSVWSVRDKHPGYNASDSDSE